MDAFDTTRADDARNVPLPDAWAREAVPAADYERIARALTSTDSPVGIDAKHTHVLILHALDRIEKRLAALERRLEPDSTGRNDTTRPA